VDFSPFPVSRLMRFLSSQHDKGIRGIMMIYSQDAILIASGKHTKSYWTWPFIVDFPIRNGDFP
jgi:hypothetical protein